MKGYLFEIDAAYELEQQGHKVLQMSSKYRKNNRYGDIDIIFAEGGSGGPIRLLQCKTSGTLLKEKMGEFLADLDSQLASVTADSGPLAITGSPAEIFAKRIRFVVPSTAQPTSNDLQAIGNKIVSKFTKSDKADDLLKSANKIRKGLGLAEKVGAEGKVLSNDEVLRLFTDVGPPL